MAPIKRILEGFCFIAILDLTLGELHLTEPDSFFDVGEENRSLFGASPPELGEVPCSFETTLDQDSEALYWETPGFRSGAYLSDQRCEWNVSVPDNFQVEFQVVEGASESCCDYVEIYRIGSEIGSGSHFARVAGSVETRRRFVSPRSDMKVVFTSDDSVNDQGYRGFFRAVPASLGNFGEEEEGSAFDEDDYGECRHDYYLNEGDESFFYSPEYPAYYPNNVECTYTFNAPADKRVEIVFNTGYTEQCCDKIEAYSNEVSIGTYSGNLDETSIVSTNEMLTLIFQSDSSLAELGFNATYRLFSESDRMTATTRQPTIPRVTETDTSLAEVCGGNLNANGTRKNIRTPGYPYDHYSNLENCTWSIWAPADMKIEVVMESGRTESCCDFLRVFDGEAATTDGEMLAIWSGLRPAGSRVVSTSNHIVLKFTSDNTFTSSGYRVSYRAVDDSVDSTETVTEDYYHDQTTVPNIARNIMNSPQMQTANYFLPHFDFLFVNFDRNVSVETDMDSTVDSDSPFTENFSGDESFPIVEQRTEEPKYCSFDAELTEDWLNVTTPNYPYYYWNNANCNWQLSFSGMRTVEVRFKGGDETEMCCDYFQVVNVGSTTGDLLRRSGLVSYSESSYITNAYNGVRVTFNSDHSVSRKGYSVSLRLASASDELERNLVDHQNLQCDMRRKVYGLYVPLVSDSQACVGINGSQPACASVQMEMKMETGFFEQEISLEEETCVPDVGMCDSQLCDHYAQPFGDSSQLGVEFIIKRCEITCCVSESDCVTWSGGEDQEDTSSISLSTTSPTQTSTRPMIGLPEVFVSKQELVMFPGCTAEDVISDVLMCSTLFLNDYPYQKKRDCSARIDMTIMCLQQKLSRCYEGPYPSLMERLFGLDTNNIKAYENMILGSVFDRNNTGSYRDILCDDVWKSEIANSMSMSSQITQILSMFGSEFSAEARSFMIRLLSVSSSRDLCRWYSDAVRVLQKFDSNAISSLIPAHLRLLIPLDSIYPVYDHFTRLISTVELPKCLAYEKMDEYGCMKKDLDVMFVLQGSGYENQDNFNQTLFFISETISPDIFDQTRVGLISYSEYIEGRSLKEQPFIRTEIPSGYFNTLQEFKDAVGQIQVHSDTSSKTYTGRALMKALLFERRPQSVKDYLKDDCVQKVVVLIAVNETYDKAQLHTLKEDIMRDQVYVIAIAMKEATAMDLQEIILPGQGQLIQCATAADLSAQQGRMKEVWKRLLNPLT